MKHIRTLPLAFSGSDVDLQTLPTMPLVKQVATGSTCLSIPPGQDLHDVEMQLIESVLTKQFGRPLTPEDWGRTMRVVTPILTRGYYIVTYNRLVGTMLLQPPKDGNSPSFKNSYWGWDFYWYKMCTDIGISNEGKGYGLIA